MARELCVTTDFMDDLIRADRLIDETYIDAMMAYCASFGAKRHEWVLDTIWSIYPGYSGGFDLLQVACDAAHRHGMRFDVVFKPFEGAMAHPALVMPPTMPKPEGIPVLETPGGLVYAVRPFVVENPHMRLARKPGSQGDLNKPIAAIRLVKADDGPITFSQQDISIWTSAVNGSGSFKRYQGPMSWRDEVSWRHTFPTTDKGNRVITLGDLKLPDDTRFIRVTCEKKIDASFRHHNDKLIELVDADGNVQPSTHSLGLVNAEALYEKSFNRSKLGLTRYLSHPDVQERLNDRQWFLDQCKDMYSFEVGGDTHCTLDGEGELVVMRGKSMHILGALSPVYPEVRQEWLKYVQYCIDRGVDGVNIRMASHNRPSQPWEHGFNEPVLKASVNPGNIAETEKINGDAMTKFISDAGDLLHNAGKELGVHVNGMMFQWSDRHGQPFGPIFQNIEYQWEKWIAEFADYIEFRGAADLFPQNLERIIDKIGLVTRNAGKAFIFQCTRSNSVVHPHSPHHTLAHEMRWIKNHPDVTCFNLYELANVTLPSTPETGFKGSEAIAKLVRENWD